jgi:hypothetical protein
MGKNFHQCIVRLVKDTDVITVFELKQREIAEHRLSIKATRPHGYWSHILMVRDSIEVQVLKPRF